MQRARAQCLVETSRDVHHHSLATWHRWWLCARSNATQTQNEARDEYQRPWKRHVASLITYTDCSGSKTFHGPTRVLTFVMFVRLEHRLRQLSDEAAQLQSSEANRSSKRDACSATLGMGGPGADGAGREKGGRCSEATGAGPSKTSKAWLDLRLN